jgi:hypothetical protein
MNIKVSSAALSRDGMISQKSWTTGEAVVLEAGILKKPVAYDEIIDLQFVRSTLAALKN